MVQRPSVLARKFWILAIGGSQIVLYSMIKVISAVLKEVFLKLVILFQSPLLTTFFWHFCPNVIPQKIQKWTQMEKLVLPD